MEAVIDQESFKTSTLDYLSKDEIKEIRREIEQFKDPHIDFEWLIKK